jgi:ubiquinone/menaquinone biosynthesis C-methylase UbiE
MIHNMKAAGDAHADASIHHKWVANYRTPEMQEFYDMAFDRFISYLAAPPNALILDAGCGTCAKSILLAAKGFRVMGVDYSADALALAAEAVKGQGLAGKITLKQDNLLGLSFPDHTFQYVLCWGVLMHIPDVGRALSELARVTGPGGMIVISEGNMHSWQAVAMRGMKALLGRERAEVSRVPAGIEYVEKTQQGTLLTRQTDFAWLMAECERLGCEVIARIPGQFTELYVAVPWQPIKRLIHVLNRIWFKYVRWTGPAFGNMLILRKRTER